MTFKSYDNSSEKIEWNSNELILKRLNEYINCLNGCVMDRNLNGAVDYLRFIYKHIVGDLTEEERKIWLRVQRLMQLNNPLSKENSSGFNVYDEGMLWMEVDEIHIALMIAAKNHGYLTSNKDDLSGL